MGKGGPADDLARRCAPGTPPSGTMGSHERSPRAIHGARPRRRSRNPQTDAEAEPEPFSTLPQPQTTGPVTIELLLDHRRRAAHRRAYPADPGCRQGAGARNAGRRFSSPKLHHRRTHDARSGPTLRTTHEGARALVRHPRAGPGPDRDRRRPRTGRRRRHRPRARPPDDDLRQRPEPPPLPPPRRETRAARRRGEDDPDVPSQLPASIA